MTVNFPAAPADGTTHDTGNGIVYVFDSAIGAWRLTASAAGANMYLSSLGVPVGVIPIGSMYVDDAGGGSQYIRTNDGTNDTWLQISAAGGTSGSPTVSLVPAEESLISAINPAGTGVSSTGVTYTVPADGSVPYVHVRALSSVVGNGVQGAAIIEVSPGDVIAVTHGPGTNQVKITHNATLIGDYNEPATIAVDMDTFETTNNVNYLPQGNTMLAIIAAASQASNQGYGSILPFTRVN